MCRPVCAPHPAPPVWGTGARQSRAHFVSWQGLTLRNGLARPGLSLGCALCFSPAGIRASHIHGVQSSLWVFLKIFFSMTADSQRDVGLEPQTLDPQGCCALVLGSPARRPPRFPSSETKHPHTKHWKSKGRRNKGGSPIRRGEGETPAARAAQGFRRAAEPAGVSSETCSGGIFKTAKSHLLIVCFQQQWLKKLGEIR